MTATAINQVANDNAQLLDAVYTFLTTNVDLVSAGEEWVSMEYTAGVSFIIKGVGLGGTEAIYIGWRLIDDVGNDVYNIEMRGFGGYASGNPWDLQPFPQPASVYLASYNLPFNYWIVANGRRFIVIEKISSVYLSCYCGLFLPYASPTQYPYPLLVSASTPISTVRWSSVTDIQHAGSPVGSTDLITSGFLYNNSGWWGVRNRSGSGFASEGPISVLPFNNENWRGDIKQDVDGGYTVFDALLLDNNSTGIIGMMEGLGFVSGFGQLAENTVTFDGDTWLVIQDVYRTTVTDYYAVRLL